MPGMFLHEVLHLRGRCCAGTPHSDVAERFAQQIVFFFRGEPKPLRSAAAWAASPLARRRARGGGRGRGNMFGVIVS